MRLSVLRDVLGEMEEDRGLPLARAAARAWFGEDSAPTLVRGSANVVCVQDTPTGRYVVRLAPPHTSERATLEAELDWLDHLAEAGLRVPQSLPSRAGRRVEHIDGPHGSYATVVLDYMHGDVLDAEEVTDDQVRLWGRALGEVHAAGGRAHVGSRPDWRDTVATLGSRLPGDDEAARRVWRRVTDALQRLPVDEGYGLIHGDAELDNVVWDQGRPSFIDFDDCAQGWYAADVAFATRDLWGDRFADIDLAEPRLGMFLAGYREAHPISEAAVEALPVFAAMHALTSYASLLGVVDIPVEDTPQWVAPLRARLLEIIEGYRSQLASV